MENDQELKNLIEKSSFLAFEEKGFLISKLPQLSFEKKKRLKEFLIAQEVKIFTINLKYLTNFQNLYSKWQNIFDQISQII